MIYYLYAAAKKKSEPKVKSDGFSYANTLFPPWFLQLVCLSGVQKLWEGRTFCWVLFFLFFFYFLPSLFFSFSAASDHYLIGNNITVAVLGIVIPIGE